MIESQHQVGDLLSRYQAGFNLLGRLTGMQHAERKVRKPLRLSTVSRLQYFSDDDDPVMSLSFDLPSSGAIDYLRDLTPVTRQIFDGLTLQYKADAFTVAGVNDQRIIQRAAIDFALANARDFYDDEIATAARYLVSDDLLLVVLKTGQRLAIRVRTCRALRMRTPSW